MARMQVLRMGLVLVLSWTDWASSSTVEPTKMEGRWYHIFTVSNDLDWLSDHDHLHLYSPYFKCIGHNCDAIRLRFQFRYMGYCSQYYKVLEKQHEGLYQTTGVPIYSIPPENILEVLDLSDSMLLLGNTYRSLSSNTYSVLALGRERTLSEADMEKFQKVLQEKGFGKQPVHFTDDDICIEDPKRRAIYIH